jgi:SAM-dependent methyltransferase
MGRVVSQVLSPAIPNREPRIPGTEGYAEQALALSRDYESLAFADVHGELVGLIPPAPSDILDIGAGSGRDAGHLASIGHRVVAVEPVRAFREIGRSLHPHANIAWLDDALPGLDGVIASGRTFDLVVMSAVLMHLDGPERRIAMARASSLLRPSGILYVLVRHGPPAPGRTMHAVPDAEITRLAGEASLSAVSLLRHEDRFGRQGISWSSAVFRDPRSAYRTGDAPFTDGDTRPAEAPGPFR